MRAGKLRHRLDIQEDRGTSQDSYGQHVANWVTLWTRWAEVRPMEATEVLESGQFKTERKHIVRMRYLADLNTRHRFKFGSRYLDITGIRDPHERNREMLVDCTERL